MTPEEILATLTALAPVSLVEMPAELRAAMRSLLIPSNVGFTEQQFAWLGEWWLVIPLLQLELIEQFNQLSAIKLAPRQTIAQEWVLPAALLTDQETYSWNELPLADWQLINGVEFPSAADLFT